MELSKIPHVIFGIHTDKKGITPFCLSPTQQLPNTHLSGSGDNGEINTLHLKTILIIITV